MKINGFLFAILMACAVPVASATQASVVVDRASGNWPDHGRDPGEERYSPLAQVNDRNVDNLGLAWSYKYPLDRVVEATPIVV